MLALLQLIKNGRTFVTTIQLFNKKLLSKPMEATISPILAANLIDDLWDIVNPTFPFKFYFIKKYMDDIIWYAKLH